MTARTLLTDGQRDQIFVQDGDRLLIENHLPALDVSLTLKASAQRAVTYVRATGSGELSRSSAVTLPTQGMSLRDLLVSERLDIGKNRDLLVRLVRSDGHYRLSAQQILLGKENKNINLRAGDHVIVEDIAYVDDAALLVGELRAPSRMPIDRNSRTTLSEALFTGGIFGSEDADFRHVYVLRGEGVEYDAYHFDISEVLNLGLAEQFELRPRDIVFVGTRPISGYNRALALSLIFLGGLEQLRTVGQ
jgi:polysaccharide export outer membrane protein